MQVELLKVIVRAIVSNPEAVKVTEERRQAQTILLLEVAPEDVGRVIGRQGRIIKAIRKVLRTAGGPRGKYVTVDVVSR